MFSIQQLCENINDAEELDDFLKKHINDIISFFRNKYSVLLKYRWEIDDCITLNENIISQLDFSKYYNSLFLFSFLDYLERFKIQNAYQILYDIAVNNKLQLGYRHKAAHIFLLEINFKSEHYDKFAQVVENLQIAYETEEDNEVSVLITFSNYISNAIRNTADVDASIVNAIFDKVVTDRNKFNFLSASIVDEILELDIDKYNNTDKQIQSIIQKLSDTKINLMFSNNLRLLETGTEYSELLEQIKPDFDSIRNISMQKYNSLTSVDKVKLRRNLMRGVKIIDNEELLFAYMTLYGKKHQAKLNNVFKNLLELPDEFNIIDWACGQGLASIVFFDYIKRQNVDCNINQVVLSEPSKLALERASLHIQKYYSDAKVKTVNKDIDSLDVSDIAPNNNWSNIHFFSNILDIELFDMAYLFNLIENSFIGYNYFICVSPYIDNKKRDRIELFVKHFENQYNNSFELLHTSDRQNSDPTWVIRVFKVEF